MADENDDVHRLKGSSGHEKGGLVIMKKRKDESQADDTMAPPKKSMFGLDKLASQKRKEQAELDRSTSDEKTHR